MIFDLNTFDVEVLHTFNVHCCGFVNNGFMKMIFVSVEKNYEEMHSFYNLSYCKCVIVRNNFLKSSLCNKMKLIVCIFFELVSLKNLKL